jgi:hypothetical protein
MSKYLYHFLPKGGMKGEVLYPLNALKDIMPEVYVRQVKKYEGREKTLKKTIPFLNCLWNDVLHLSPIHPQIVVDTMKAYGLYSQKMAGPFVVFQVPVEIIAPETTVYFQDYNFDYQNFDLNKHKFWLFHPATYEEQSVVSVDQLRVWQEDKVAGRPLFWYSHTAHVLAKQTIPITACKLITCQ